MSGTEISRGYRAFLSNTPPHNSLFIFHQEPTNTCVRFLVLRDEFRVLQNPQRASNSHTNNNIKIARSVKPPEW